MSFVLGAVLLLNLLTCVFPAGLVSSCSLYLFKLGLAPQIQDLYGKVDFTGKTNRPASVLLSIVNPDVAVLQKVAESFNCWSLSASE